VALRWLVWITGIFAVSLLVLWIVPSLLTRHPDVQGAERHTAIAATRVGVVAYVVAAGAVVTLAYTARTYRLTKTGQVTDRYIKAIGQLGDTTIDVRLGAIYALERIAKDSPDDQPTIMEVLAAYIRERTLLPAEAFAVDSPPTLFRTPTADVAAALTVITRRTSHPDESPIDLRGTNLSGVNPPKKACLEGVHLERVRWIAAHLNDANLSRAHLNDANLTGAHLQRADLTRAVLIDADLNRASLIGAHLSHAVMIRTILTFTDLTGADLTGAVLMEGGLTPEQLEQVSGADTITWHPPHPDAPPRPS
jgi:hypothetical protein